MFVGKKKAQLGIYICMCVYMCVLNSILNIYDIENGLKSNLLMYL